MKLIMLRGEREFLKIDILKKRDSETSDYWDSNWLESVIQVEVPGFKAHYQANLHIEDLNKWHKNLHQALTSAPGQFSLPSIEEEISMECHIRKNGAVLCSGKADNHNGNSLNFTLTSDLASLDQFFAQLEYILLKYR